MLAAGLAVIHPDTLRPPRRTLGRAALTVLAVLTASSPTLLAPLALSLIAPAPALAVPLNVRAKTRVALEHRRGPDGLELSGRLTDDREDPIPGERLSLELGSRVPESLVTDADGRFSLTLDRRSASSLERAHGTRIPWTLRYPGSRRFGETVDHGELDLTRRSSRLLLALDSAPGEASPATGRGDAPTRIRRSLADGPLTLTARLEDALGRRPVTGAEVRLRVGESSELVGATGPSGQVTFVLRPDLLEAGERYRVVARFSGDLVFAPALSELELEVTLPTRVTLRIVREGDARHGRYRFSGRLSDQDGPLRRRVVVVEGYEADPSGAIESADRPTFTRLVATGDDGLFVTAIGAAELAGLEARRLLVQAGFFPEPGPHLPARSQPILMDIPIPPGVPLRWYAAALFSLFSLLALARLYRSGALARLWRLVAAWVADLVKSPPAGTPTLPAGAPSYVTPATPTGASRRSDWLAGVVIDDEDGAPLDATITARSKSGLETARTGTDGRFELGPLGAGVWLVTLEARAHLPRELSLEIPHTGGFDGSRWALKASRREVRELFGQAIGVHGEALAWGDKTPRESLEGALARTGDRQLFEPPLRELTNIVEAAHFARDPVPLADVERARALRRQVEPEPGGSGQGSHTAQRLGLARPTGGAS